MPHREDDPHASGDVGELFLGVRNDALAALASADGDYAPTQVNGSGALYQTPMLQEAVELLASAARTETGNGSAVTVDGSAEAIVFQLDVTAAATDADDTLDVAVQTTIDGTNWIDVVAFTQVVGDGGAKRHVAKVAKQLAESMFSDAALSAGSVRHLFGRQYRVKWTVADPTGDNASFTFSVTANVG